MTKRLVALLSMMSAATLALSGLAVPASADTPGINTPALVLADEWCYNGSYGLHAVVGVTDGAFHLEYGLSKGGNKSNVNIRLYDDAGSLVWWYDSPDNRRPLVWYSLVPRRTSTSLKHNPDGTVIRYNYPLFNGPKVSLFGGSGRITFKGIFDRSGSDPSCTIVIPRR